MISIWDVAQLALPEQPGDAKEASPISYLEGHRAAVNALVMTQDKIISGSGDGAIRLWDIATLSCICVIEGYHEKGIATLTLSPDGSRVVSGSSDTTIRIFDIETGAEKACLYGHSTLVRSVCVIPAEHEDEGGWATIISRSYDGQICVWGRTQGDEQKWNIKIKYNVSQALSKFDNTRETNRERMIFKLLSNGDKLFCASSRTIFSLRESGCR